MSATPRRREHPRPAAKVEAGQQRPMARVAVQPHKGACICSAAGSVWHANFARMSNLQQAFKRGTTAGSRMVVVPVGRPKRRRLEAQARWKVHREVRTVAENPRVACCVDERVGA